MENRNDMPLGLAFQLSMDEKAMENFAKLSEGEKKTGAGGGPKCEFKG